MANVFHMEFQTELKITTAWLIYKNSMKIPNVAIIKCKTRTQIYSKWQNCANI